jgi:hypothetical protein
LKRENREIRCCADLAIDFFGRTESGKAGLDFAERRVRVFLATNPLGLQKGRLRGDILLVESAICNQLAVFARISRRIGEESFGSKS